MGVPNSAYQVETISSFVQKYVLSFYMGGDIPEESDNKVYYPFILEKGISLFKVAPIRKVLSLTFEGLFVDEYQDCTRKQHELIQVLAELFPTRILGDPLQGIFGFNGDSLVDMNAELLGGFYDSKYELRFPQRWLNGNNSHLGNDLKAIRSKLLSGMPIDLTEHRSIEVVLVSERDIYNPKGPYNSSIRKLIRETDILLIHPDSSSIYPRLNIIKRFNNAFTLIEAIDDKDFYILATMSDSLTSKNFRSSIYSLGVKVFNKTGLDYWFNAKGFKKKSNSKEQAAIQPIESMIERIEANFSFSLVADVLQAVSELNEIKCYRKDLFKSLCNTLYEASSNNIPVSTAMERARNLTRRIGRKVHGRCIGTTLLTKGLEFDSVAIINAHKFECPKHLYVALTRACKRLIIFTENAILNPY